MNTKKNLLNCLKFTWNRLPHLCSFFLLFLNTYSFPHLRLHLLTANPITVDPADTRSNRARVDNAPNGVPVVDIARPNSHGVSHNLFQNFNVGEKGAVMNNSNEDFGKSVLAGVLLANSNLNGTEGAHLILNEVTGGHPSDLQGYTEIFGREAEYILANPYGISCAGCGFINTPRAVLTTGQPQLEDGRLSGFAVDQGSVRFYKKNERNGINAANLEYFDVISRRVVIEAEVLAKNLSFFLGKNNFDYAARRIVTQRAAGAAGDTPAWALDAAALGSMYADRIYLESTEKGAGVHIAGNMAANAHDLEIRSDGRIALRNAVSAKGNLSLASKEDINLQNRLHAEGSLKIKADGTFSSAETAQTSSKQDIEITAKQNAEIDGILYAEGSLKIKADGTFSSAETAQTSSKQDIEITAKQNAEIDGSLHAKGSLTIKADGTFSSAETAQLFSKQDMEITAKQNAAADGSLYAEGGLKIKADASFSSAETAQLFSKQDMEITAKQNAEIDGSLYAEGGLKIKADGSFSSAETAQLFSKQDMEITAKQNAETDGSFTQNKISR